MKTYIFGQKVGGGRVIYGAQVNDEVPMWSTIDGITYNLKLRKISPVDIVYGLPPNSPKIVAERYHEVEPVVKDNIRNLLNL
ncbi:MAG: hypothetical protein HYX24_07120 [Candidatus Aenigmarchaeota archaeon]|nr:hypothetical protein [Candidatus Aenigmarchaeota archaeon]